MTEPLVTVVIPVYNVEKYLDRCVSSVTGQTYQNLEILLIDDGSPDNCPAMCDAWARKDSRIQVTHQKNAGVGMARNAGIEKASGDYLYLLDSDDYIAPETISVCCRAASEEKADVVVFGLKSLDKNGKTRLTAKSDKRKCYSGAEIRDAFILGMVGANPETGWRIGPWMNFGAMLMSANLIRRANWKCVSEKEFISDDLYSILTLYSYVERAVVLPDMFYYYCENEASLTRSYRKDRFPRLMDSYRKFMSLCEECQFHDAVERELTAMFVGSTIAAAKQTVSAPLAFSRRLALLREIVSDELLQKMLNETRFHKRNLQRRLLEYVWRHQLTLLSYCLLKLKIKSAGSGTMKAGVSVIVPAYNAEKTLGKCLDSLLAQDYDNYEIIVVDDGSEDNTQGVAESYDNEKVVCVSRPKFGGGGGVSAARNEGIRHAHGEYLIFCDSDDCVSPHYVRALIENADGDSLVICASTKEYRRLDAEDMRIPFLEFDYTQSPEKLFALLEAGYAQSVWCKLFKKSVIDAHGLAFDQNMCFIEDTKFVFQYLYVVKKIVYLNRALYFYNTSDSTLTKLVSDWIVNSYLSFVEFLAASISNGSLEAARLTDYYNKCVALNYYTLSLRAYAYLPYRKACALRNKMKSHPLVLSVLQNYSYTDDYPNASVNQRMKRLVPQDSELIWALAGFLKRWAERVKRWEWTSHKLKGTSWR